MILLLAKRFNHWYDRLNEPQRLFTMVAMVAPLIIGMVLCPSQLLIIVYMLGFIVLLGIRMIGY